MPLTYFATATLVQLETAGLGGTYKGRPRATGRACPSTEFGSVLVPTVLCTQHSALIAQRSAACGDGRMTIERWVAFISPVSITAAFLLQLFCSLSLPVIKPIHLLAVHVDHAQRTSTANEVRFGLWGYCALNVYDTGFTDFGSCSKPAIGYDPAPFLVLVTGQQGLVRIAFKALTYFLILHPIVAILTLIALIPSTFVRVKWARIFSLVITIISAILSTVVFGIDVAIVNAARIGVKEYLGENTNISILYGREVWMSLVAVLLLWTAVVSHSLVSCYCCGRVQWNDEECNDEEIGKQDDL